jgi:uncharacterized protein YqjF (DUF2071 family)
MNALKEVHESESNVARKRLLSVPGDPFLYADWERILFLHFAIAPKTLEPLILRPLELELYEGKAILSVVAVTMRRFKSTRPFPLGWVPALLTSQRFLNFRTYVRHGEEPGALFLWGWLSRPISLPLPTFGLPCAFANVDYRQNIRSGELRGEVKADTGCFNYSAQFDIKNSFNPCPTGSLAEFAMERYTGFFYRGNRVKIFRAWHPAWLQTGVDVNINDASLLTKKFSWFKEAKLVDANFTPGFNEVALGRVHSLENMVRRSRNRGHGTSAFFEMP